MERLKDTIAGALKTAKLSSGLKPVYKVETCDSLDFGLVGDRVIVNSFPSWVRIKAPRKSIKELLKQEIKDTVGDELSRFISGVSHIDESPLLGIMIDESYKNPMRFVVNLIFQDVLKQNPSGNEWLGENLIKIGYPIRITLGFVTPEGAFLKHPYAKPVKTPIALDPNFTGVVGAASKEVMASGDRFQITCVGFEYLLSKFETHQFIINPDESAKSILARLLLEWATGKKQWSRGLTPRIPKTILKECGVVDRREGFLFPKKKIEENIRFVDTPETLELRTDIKQPIEIEPNVKRVNGVEKLSLSFLDILNELKKNECFGAEIFFDHDGILTVQSRYTTTDRIARNSVTSDDPTRVHDAVIGSNVLHHQSTSDLDSIAGNVLICEEPALLASELPRITRIENLAKSISGLRELRVPPETELEKYYRSGFGFVPLYVNPAFFHFSSPTGKERKEVRSKFAEKISDRYRYWGMRGSSYMILNPRMRVGDVLRVTDIRDKEGIGINVEGLVNLSRNAREKIRSVFGDMGIDVPGDFGNRLGLGTLENYYYIWKVRHYVGQDKFTSKAFFIKEPFSLVKTSELYRQHMYQRRRRTTMGEEMPVGSAHNV